MWGPKTRGFSNIEVYAAFVRSTTRCEPVACRVPGGPVPEPEQGGALSAMGSAVALIARPPGIRRRARESY